MTDQRAWTDGSRAYEIDLASIASESASVAVYRAVAALTGRRPEHLEPLGGAVDADAHDALLDSTADSDARCRVAFSYQGYRVEIVAGETIRLTPLRDDIVDETDR